MKNWIGLLLMIGVFPARAAEVVKQSGIQGGLIVYVGCTDGQRTAELLVNESFRVHALSDEETAVAATRKAMQDKGLADRISVSQTFDDTIPFIDNFVTLLVVEDAGRYDDSEVLRVLAPGAVAMIGEGEGYRKIVKPLSEDRDEWTHYLYDASNNAVSKDKLVSSPKHMQFRTGLEWVRSHHKQASVSTVVTAKGRMFYVLDTGPGSNMEVPASWHVVGRDAYNSTLLWQRPVESWTMHTRGFRSGPVQMQRLMVTNGERVFLPLSIKSSVEALDAVTGKTDFLFEGSKGAEELIMTGNTLLIVCGDPFGAQAASLDGASAPKTRKVLAYDANTGKQLWKKEQIDLNHLVGATLCADDQRVYYMATLGETALDLESGKVVWSTIAEPVAGKKKAAASKDKKKRKPAGLDSGAGSATMVISESVLFSLRGKKINAVDSRNGQKLWEGDGSAGFRSAGDVLVINGQLWTGTAFGDARDPKTGELLQTIDSLKSIQTAGHHHRCYRNKATENFIIAGHRGLEYMDVSGNEDHDRNNWIRGLCQYGVMPANGLTYAPPHSCGCYMEAKLYGFWAVAAEREKWSLNTKDSLVVKGPAYGKTEGADAAPDEWPTFAQNNTRGATIPTNLDAKPTTRWQTRIGTDLSAPVVANGLVLLTDTAANTVFALDAKSGKKSWSYLAGGGIDSPPTIHKGLAIFGCRDGWVYAVRVNDGVVAWKFRAAPADMRTMDMDNIESLWPVAGSVMVQNDTAYVCAGRNSYIDDGLFFYALDPATGRVKHRRNFLIDPPKIYTRAEALPFQAEVKPEKISQNTTDYRTFRSPDRADAFSMHGNMNDIICGNGKQIFLRHRTYDAKWQDHDPVLHLFSTSHFTDGNENIRSHMNVTTGDFGRTIYAYPWIPGRFGEKLNYPFGVMIACEGDDAWGVQRGGSAHGVYKFFRKEIPGEIEGRKNDLVRTGGNWQFNVNPGFRPRSIMKAENLVVLAGQPDMDPADPFASYEGRLGGVLKTFDLTDGSVKGEVKISAPPVWAGMASAKGSYYLALTDGSVVCLK